jgi:hypothetical protein
MNEVALTAASVTDVRELRRFLDGLRALWRRDPEAGHSINDQIRARVLEMCAEGHPDAALLAREVLVTDTWDDCPEWFA